MPRAQHDKYEPMLPDDWRLRTATPGESVRSLLPQVNVIVCADEAAVGRTKEQLVERTTRAAAEPIVGVQTGGDGFSTLSPTVVVEPPIAGDELRETLQTLRIRSAYDDAIREYYSLVDCMSAMETNRSGQRLDDDPVYQRIQGARKRQRERVETLRDLLIEHNPDAAFTPLDASITEPAPPERPSGAATDRQG